MALAAPEMDIYQKQAQREMLAQAQREMLERREREMKADLEAALASEAKNGYVRLCRISLVWVSIHTARHQQEALHRAIAAVSTRRK